MRPVMLLARLNDVDLALDSIKARLAEIAEALREPRELAAARRALVHAEAELARCRAIQEDLELRQQDAQTKLAKAEGRLYSGEVKNPKELAGAEKDVQQLRRQLGQVEDRLLDALVCSEAATQACTEHGATVARLTAEWEARQAALRGEQARLKARLPVELARQAAARKAVPAELLPTYDNLRPRRGGRAVAELDGDECGACCVAAAPSTLEAARYGDELVYCSNCGRLLWGE
jgi:predicted  nucleic acid-binding Zn-ribbon protein